MKKWLRSEPVVLLWRIFLLYAAWFLTKAIFYFYNHAIIADITEDEFRRLVLGSYRFDTTSILYTNAFFILLSLLPFHFRERGWYRATMFWYYVVVNGVMLAVNLADAVYFRYTQTRFTSDEIFFADNDNSLQLIFQFAAENWYMVLAWAALVAMLVLLYGRKWIPRTPIDNKQFYYITGTLVFLASIPICIAGIRGGNLHHGLRPISIPNATMFTTDAGKANLILSNPFCILRSKGGGKTSCRVYYEDTAMLDSVFSPYHYPDRFGDGMHGAYKDYNVVVFVLESFSAEHSAFLNPDLYPDGGGYTPFIDSLMGRGLTFHRGYANGSKSVAALPSILASVPSYKTPFMLMPQSIAPGDQLPRILDKIGYNTMFFNGSLRGSMGFEAYGRLAGIKNFYAQDEYIAERGPAEYDGVWGIWDEPFLDYMGEVMGRSREPFFSTVFTISSHHPFKVPEKYRESLPKGTTKIHQPAAYTDLALRRFFDKYAGSPWMDRTLFVFVADHVSSERWADKTLTPLGLQHIVLFFYSPDGRLGGQRDDVFQQIDIMPTVLGLVGHDEPYFAYGRDAFNEPEREPFVMTYNSVFQGISDSLTVYFDENEIIRAYLATDTLQRNDIADPADASQQHYKRLMEAMIQQYYKHLRDKDYFVRDR